MPLRIDMALKRLRESLKLLEEEKDRNGNLAIREALSHASTAEMWLAREQAHQDSKHE